MGSELYEGEGSVDLGKSKERATTTRFLDWRRVAPSKRFRKRIEIPIGLRLMLDQEGGITVLCF